MSANPVPLKVGEVLVPKADTTWETNYTEMKLVSKVMHANTEYWWVKLTTTWGMTTLDTFSVEGLRSSWERRETFYRIGNKYKFPMREDVFYVMDVYTVDKPAYDWGRHKAIARMITPDGKEDIQTLSMNDFNRMVRV